MSCLRWPGGSSCHSSSGVQAMSFCTPTLVCHNYQVVKAVLIQDRQPTSSFTPHSRTVAGASARRTVTLVNVMTVTKDSHSSECDDCDKCLYSTKCDDCDSHCSECDDHDREQSLVDVMTVTGLLL